MGKDAGVRPSLVLLTSHLIDLEAVIVAPLLAGRTLSVPGAEVQVMLDGEAHLLALIQMTAINSRLRRRPPGSLQSYETDIRRAIDRLFTRF